MEALQLEAYLHRHIPLSQAMQVRVSQATPDTVVLCVPLAPNLNHRDTAFGGSIGAAALLAGWSLLSLRLSAAALPARLVIQRSRTEYEQPIDGDFTVHAFLGSAAEWERFMRTLTRRGRARLSVGCEIRHVGRKAASFAGEFVALAPEGRQPRDLI